MTRARRDASKLVNRAIALGAVLGAVVTVQTLARRRRRISLRGRVALVTGGSRGLGLAVARELVRHGARVAICGREEAELTKARTVLERNGAEVVTFVCDVTDQGEVDGMLDWLRERLGPVDVLINNAGTLQVGPMGTMTLEDYQRELRGHFSGPLHTTLGVLPDMRRRRAGRIVNIASIGGKVAVPHALPYKPAKFALIGFSDGLRAALARDNIYVTTVNPVLRRTASPRNEWPDGRHRKEFAWYSLSDSLALLSMSAERAARCVVEACRYGDARLVTPLAVKLRAAVTNNQPATTHDHSI